MRTKFVAAACAAFILANLLVVAPASATGTELIVSGYPTGVSSDCARVGTYVAGSYAHHSNVDDDYTVLTESVSGADKTPLECAQSILTFMKNHARGVYTPDSNYTTQLRSLLFSGGPDLSKPYQVFLNNLYVSISALRSLTNTVDGSLTGLGSCQIAVPLFVIHCVDDNNGGVVARDSNGNIIYVGGQPWVINLGGAMSQGGGTMYGNVFFEDEVNAWTFDGQVQHHEQVHSQQWAQWGWTFVNKYATSLASSASNANYFYLMWGRIEGLRVPSICFVSYERAAGFSDGHYALRWDEDGGAGDGITFPQTDLGYPNSWTSDWDNPDKRCPANWT